MSWSQMNVVSNEVVSNEWSEMTWPQLSVHQVKQCTFFPYPFNIPNGEKQMSVLSPYPFSFYLDELPIPLPTGRVGCIVDNMIVNPLLFAGALCVFALA